MGVGGKNAGLEAHQFGSEPVCSFRVTDKQLHSRSVFPMRGMGLNYASFRGDSEVKLLHTQVPNDHVSSKKAGM